MNQLHHQIKMTDLFAEQQEIASRVVLEDRFSFDRVAGVDQAFLKVDDRSDIVISGAVVLGRSFDVIEMADCALKTSFPYISGLLSFREGPSAICAVRMLENRPTLLFVDGCGINHPRFAGLASYIGVMLDMPTIGICKSLLCGTFDPPGAPGDASPLIYGGRHVGYVFLSKEGCRPIVVAPGHLITVESALEITRRYLRGAKLPEPCRQAHIHANGVKRRMDGGRV